MRIWNTNDLGLSRAASAMTRTSVRAYQNCLNLLFAVQRNYAIIALKNSHFCVPANLNISTNRLRSTSVGDIFANIFAKRKNYTQNRGPCQILAHFLLAKIALTYYTLHSFNQLTWTLMLCSGLFRKHSLGPTFQPWPLSNFFIIHFENNCS